MSVSTFLLAVTNNSHVSLLDKLRSGVQCGIVESLWVRSGGHSVTRENFSSDYFFFYHFYLKLYSCLAALGLCCCTQAFSSCGKLGLLSSYGTWASQMLWFLLLWNLAVRHAGPIVVARGFSYSKACGIFPGQKLNLCPLY